MWLIEDDFYFVGLVISGKWSCESGGKISYRVFVFSVIDGLSVVVVADGGGLGGERFFYFFLECFVFGFFNNLNFLWLEV